jgi:hypothetical protein
MAAAAAVTGYLSDIRDLALLLPSCCILKFSRHTKFSTF